MKNKFRYAIDSIKKRGYFVLQNQFSKQTCDKLLTLTKDLYHSKAGKFKDKTYLMQNTDAILNLQNKNILFIKAISSSKILEEILKYFLNDKWYRAIRKDYPNYIIRSYAARSSIIKMPMHIDSLIPYKGNEVVGMPCSIILEDQNLENGCTIVKPGSHLSGRWAKQNSKIKPIISKAGDIVIWDGRVWHGTTSNKSGKSRWALISNFVRWWVKQLHDIPKGLPKEIYNKLSVKEKIILGFCSYPYKNEFEGSEMKRGLNTLHKR